MCAFLYKAMEIYFAFSGFFNAATSTLLGLLVFLKKDMVKTQIFTKLIKNQQKLELKKD